MNSVLYSLIWEGVVRGLELFIFQMAFQSVTRFKVCQVMTGSGSLISRIL